MNPVAEEIESYIGSSSMSGKDFLEHYGIRRRSGRYPWGSGKDPYQSGRDFLGRVEEMRKSGFTYTDENGKKWTGDPAIAKSLGYSTTDFRTVYAIAKDERRSDMVATARRLKEKEGMNNSEIGRKMGINESSVRSLLDPNSESKMKQARETAEFLKKQVDKKKMVDVGAGVERDLNISKEKLDQALFMLQAEGGYEVYGNRFPQATNRNQMTSLTKKLDIAQSNVVKERAAQRMTYAAVQKKQNAAKEAGEVMKAKDVKKASQQALTRYREEVGSVSRRDRNIVITDNEWKAIQAGAISENILNKILNNCDPDSLRQKAMPKESKELNEAKQLRIKAMSASYTISQIADKLGISTSTVSKYLKGAN